MKKLYLGVFAIIVLTHFSYAQNTFPSTGNVGIGTTTPNAVLDIGKTLNVGETGAVLGRLPEGNTIGDGTYIGVKGYNTQGSDFNNIKSFAIEHSFYGITNSSINFFRGGSTSGGFIAFNTNDNSERMRIMPNGNVGIGTASPGAILSLGGAVSNRKLFVYDGGNEASGFGQSYSEFRIFDPISGTNHISFGRYDLGNDAFAEQMRIDYNGNVGIGATNPNGNLEIKGNTVFDASTIMRITNNSRDYGRTNLILTGRYQDGNDAWNFGSSARNSIVFAQNAASSGQNIGASGDEKYSIQLEGNSNSLGFLSKQNGSTPIMVLNQQGNVGINTTYIPSGYQLAVNGSAIATSVTVQLRTAWPDYVFKNNYAPMPLSDLKTYIDQNHHLPEIPSEKEVAEKGLNLGEMNKLLTKKVEELTLYLIEMKAEKDKKEKEQQEEINQLKQQQKLNQSQEDRIVRLENQLEALAKKVEPKQ